jgi:hypothetical protein
MFIMALNFGLPVPEAVVFVLLLATHVVCLCPAAAPTTVLQLNVLLLLMQLVDELILLETDLST